MASDQQWRREDFGPYTLHEWLGSGGMATVRRAVHRESGRHVALKRLLPQLATDKILIKQFIREAEIAQSLHHENIVGVEDYGQVGGEYYLAMELIDGQSVLALLQRANQDEQPAPVGVTVWILYHILSALDYAMTGLDSDGQPFNIVHRDLSPSNIIVTTSGQVKIIDFGVAKSLRGKYATNSGRIKGKLGYMAPEVLAGRNVDIRSDLYSASVVGWELLTAQRLFHGSESQQMALRAAHRERTPPSRFNRWVPAELDDLLAIALSEDPEARWPSAGAMSSALVTIVRDQGEGASTNALLAWLNQLAIGKDVILSSETKQRIVLPEVAGQPAEEPSLSAMETLGLRRFVSEIKTVIDPSFDPSERHRRETQGEESLMTGSADDPLTEHDEDLEDPPTVPNDPSFSDLASEDDLPPDSRHGADPEGLDH